MTKHFTEDSITETSGTQYSMPLAAYGVDIVHPEGDRIRGISVEADDTIAFIYQNGVADALTLAAGMVHAFSAIKQISSSTVNSVSNIHLHY